MSDLGRATDRERRQPAGDRPDFEMRLADAFGRWADGAPVGTDAAVLAATVVGAAASTHRPAVLRWRSGWSRAALPAADRTRQALLVALLLVAIAGAMLAVGAGLLRMLGERADRVFVTTGTSASILSLDGALLTTAPLPDGPTSGACPVLVGESTLVAFEPPGQISLVDPDGGPPRSIALTDDGDPNATVATSWSPDRSTVAVVRPGGWASAMRIAPDGTIASRDIVTTEVHGVAWMPDGQLLLARRTAGGLALALELHDLATGTTRTLGPFMIAGLYDAAHVGLAVSPDGRRILVSTPTIVSGRESTQAGPVDLALVDVSAGSMHSLLAGFDGSSGDDDWRESALDRAAWSPDGERIALRTGVGGLAILGMDGSVTDVAVSEGMDVDHLAWSPDGSRLGIGGQAAMAIADARDWSLVRLSLPVLAERPDGRWHGRQFAWLPDGGLLVARTEAGAGPETEAVIVHRFGPDLVPLGGGVFADLGVPGRRSPICVEVIPATRAGSMEGTSILPADGWSDGAVRVVAGAGAARPHLIDSGGQTGGSVMSRRQVAAGVLGLALMGAATPATTALAQEASPPPPLAPGEAWIAYQEGTPERGGAHAVHLVRTDGTGAFFALPMIPGGEQLHPDWSPDGRRMVLDAADEDGTYDLWVVDTSDWSAERVVDCQAPCLWVQEPAWSRDGTRIAFQRHTQTDAGEVSSIEVLDLATGAIDVPYETGTDRSVFAPRWSPDDGSLVFEQPTAKDGTFLGVTLEVVDLAAPGASTTIVPLERFANNSDWSPDGSLIAFSSPIEGGEPGGALSDIWVVKPDGTGMRQVTDVASSGGTAVQPTFTPDGTRIMFKLTEPPSSSSASDVMATIAIDGTDLAPATSSGYRYGWHPRLRPTG